MMYYNCFDKLQFVGGSRNKNQIIITAISICIFAVAIIVALKVVKKDKGEYDCNICNHKFEPAFKEIILSMYSENTRYLNCPNCNRKTWCKRV